MNTAQLLELITQGESARVEVNSSFQGEAIETLAAFANCQTVTVFRNAAKELAAQQPDKRQPENRYQCLTLPHTPKPQRLTTHALQDWPRVEFLDERDANQFRVILRRPEAQTEGVNDQLAVIRNNPSLRAPALAKRMGLTPKNIEHRIRQLREDPKIEFIGSPKTGGDHSQ